MITVIITLAASIVLSCKAVIWCLSVCLSVCPISFFYLLLLQLQWQHSDINV